MERRTKGRFRRVSPLIYLRSMGDALRRVRGEGREDWFPSPLFRFLTRCVCVGTLASREEKKFGESDDERNEHVKYANLFETNSRLSDSRRHKLLPHSHISRIFLSLSRKHERNPDSNAGTSRAGPVVHYKTPIRYPCLQRVYREMSTSLYRHS